MKRIISFSIILFLCASWALLVFAQESTVPPDTGASGIVIAGKYAAAPLLMLVSSFLFSIFSIESNKVKQGFVVIVGLLLAILALWLDESPKTPEIIVGYLIEGFYLGLTTIGMHQVKNNIVTKRNVPN